MERNILEDILKDTPFKMRNSPRQQWISVSDRLPYCDSASKRTGARFTVVLVYHAGGHDIAMYYEDSGFRINGVYDGSESSEELHNLKTGSITHWMPLPPAPNCESSE